MTPTALPARASSPPKHLLRRTQGLAGLLLLVLSACSSGGSGATIVEGETFGPPDVQAEAPVDYTLGPGDVIEVRVLQDERLTQTVRVDGNGQVPLSLVGNVRVGSLTTTETQAKLESLYGERFIRNPQVTVFIKEYNSQRVTVMGEVVQPGVFPLTGQAGLMETLALARGLTATADSGDVVIMRMQNGRRMGMRFDLNDIASGALADPDIYAGDTVIVGESATQAFLEDMRSVVPIISVIPGI
mgnify:CR=1 FL=1